MQHKNPYLQRNPNKNRKGPKSSLVYKLTHCEPFDSVYINTLSKQMGIPVAIINKTILNLINSNQLEIIEDKYTPSLLIE